jgi:energy-coupling factor transporter ATP-binding protein EcfA2
MQNPEYWGWEPPIPADSVRTLPTPPTAEHTHDEEYLVDLESIEYLDAEYSDEYTGLGDCPEDFADASFDDRPTATVLPSQPRLAATTLRDRVRRVLRSTLSALHDDDPQSGLQLLQRIGSSDRVLRVLPEDERLLIRAVIEVFTHEASVLSSGRIDLYHLPVVEEYSESVSAEIDRVVKEVGVSTPTDPHAQWQDLVEGIQRAHTRYAALDLAKGIDEKLPVFDLMERFRRIEPPTAIKSVSRERSAKTAREVAEAIRSVAAGRTPYRFSSGLPTLDLGYTGIGEARGFIAPGQFNVVMGPTGTGKSSFANSIVPAISMDMKNWGLDNSLQVMFHTEEESIDKLKGFRMDIGQKYHHLADNLIIDACGTSRKRLAETLYDLVIRADEHARASKRPITEFLPHVVQIDYIQSIQEPEDRDPATASAITAEFFLRGVCAWNPDEMAKFSGVDFREYAGAAWPSGMEHHRVAVIAYAQLVKIDDSTLYYQPGKRGVQLSDFALLNERDEPSWDIREGDLRLFGKNQMRGSGIIAQNAHAIVILHRSVPYNNPAVLDENSDLHLQDTRARILFDKSRSGSRMTYAPMRFDVQSTGFRAQYFDEVAEKAIVAGKLTNFDSSYVEPGDPILPVRPYQDPFGEIRY